jgi:hypothetical protein
MNGVLVVRYLMGRQTLTTLTTQTSGSTDELRTLLHQLAAAAVPARDKLVGDNWVALTNFINHTDDIATELHVALNRVLEGTHGQNVAFREADAAQADSTRAAMGRADFDSARFTSHG